jgi:hypothetical protein
VETEELARNLVTELSDSFEQIKLEAMALAEHYREQSQGKLVAARKAFLDLD